MSKQYKQYDEVIGYSPLEDVDHGKLLKLVRTNKKIIDPYLTTRKKGMVLVAGAGLGQEAVIIGREFNLKTVGVDLKIDLQSLPNNCLEITFQRQNLMDLAFRENTFSLVYCYHVLEHVPDHRIVLKEIHRVLSPGGVLFIGFPNKHRLVSYLGTAQKVSSLDKIKWNINDLITRLRGRFENEFGAHAGFTQKEFIEDTSTLFDVVHPVRNQYMLNKYSRLYGFIRLVIKTGLEEFIFPSNYYICIKREV